MDEIFFEWTQLNETNSQLLASDGVGATTLAYYEPELRVLVVDQFIADASRQTEPTVYFMKTARRFLETQDTEATAIRRAIALADEWLGEVKDLPHPGAPKPSLDTAIPAEPQPVREERRGPTRLRRSRYLP
jgi:hypothetical protein